MRTYPRSWWMLSSHSNRKQRRAAKSLGFEHLEDRSVPAVSYLTAGSSYSQNFNGLPSAGTFALTGSGPFALDAAPIGATGVGTGDWYIGRTGGTGTNAVFTVGDGSANTGSAYSYGTTSSTDRALGLLASGTTVSAAGLEIVNNTGATLNNFTVNFAAETWRRGNNNANTLNSMAFGYSIGATNILTGTFTAFTPLNAVGVNPFAPDTKSDGNAAAGRAVRSATVTGLNWTNGTKLVLRWTDADDANNDDGVGIDDFSFRAGSNVVPVTTTIADALTAAGPDGIVTVPAGTYPEAVVLTGNQQIQFTGAVTINSLAGPASSAMLINTGAVLTVGDATDTVFAGVVSGAGAIVKQGSGKLSIPGDFQLNTLSNAPTNAISIAAGTFESGRIMIRRGGLVDIAPGATWLSGGTVNLMTDTTSTYTAVSGTGMMKLNGTGSAANPDLYFGPNHRSNSNYGVLINPTLDLGSAQRFIAGRSGNNSFATYVGLANGLDADFRNPIIGSGGLTFVGQQINNGGDPVPFAVSSTSSFTGPVNVTWGSLYQNADNILNGNALSFDPVSGNNARLFLFGHNASVSNLTSGGAGSAGIANGVRATGLSGLPVAAATLSVNQTANTTYAGVIADFIAERDRASTGAASDPLSLTVTGTKSLTLTGANSYSGTTTISTTLAANNATGSATGTGAVTVSAAGTLTGTGTVTTTGITLDGKLTGTLTVTGPVTGSSTAVISISDPGTTGTMKTGSLTLVAGSELRFDLNGTAAGTGYDQLKVSGSYDLGGATLSVTTGFAAAANDVFTIIDGDTPNVSVFAGAGEGSTVSFGGQNFTISYLADNGTDVTLTRQPPPVRYVDDAWAAFTNGTPITDADPVAAGDQNAVFGSTAFAKINQAITSVPALGTVIVNQGAYSEAVLINKQITLKFQEGPVTVSSLDDSVTNAAINLDNMTLTAGDAASTQLDSPIIGSGSLVKTGGGTFTIAGINTYTGTTLVQGGSLRAGGNSVFSGTSGLTVNSGAILQLAGKSVAITNLINDGILENADAAAGTLTITGSGNTHTGLFRDGTGGGVLNLQTGTATTTTLNNTTSSYTGVTTILSGNLSVPSLANGGAVSPIGASTSAAANLVIVGGDLIYTGGTAATDRSFTVGANGAAIDVSNAAVTLTVQGTVQGGANSFTKHGAGTLSFPTNDAMVTGTVFATAGTLRLANITISKTRVLDISAGAFLESAGTIRTIADGTQNPNAVVTGAGTLKLVSPTSGVANVDIDFNVNNVDNTTANWGTQINAKVDLGSSQRYFSGKTNHNGVSRYELSGDCVFAQEITGSGGMTFIAAGNYTASGPMETPFYLAAANTFTGPVEILRGSVYLGSDNSLNGNNVSFNPAAGHNARLFLFNRSVTLGNLSSSGAGSSIIANSAGRGTYTTNTLTLHNTADTAFNGQILQYLLEYDTGLLSLPGVTGIVKTGGGTMTFGGNANTYAGSTTLTGGVLSVGGIANGSRVPFVTTVANSNLASVSDATGLAVGQVILSSTIPANVTITAINGTDITLSTGTGVTSGTVESVIYTPNSLGAPTADAANLVFNGGTLRYTGPSAESDRAFTVTELSGTIEANGTGLLNLTGANSVAYTGAGTRALNLTGSGAGKLAAIVGDSGTDAVSIVKNGAGAWLLEGVSTLTGGTTANGGTLGGNGTVGALTVNAATFAPGDSPGTFSTGNLSFSAASTYTVELASLTSFDQTKATGTVSLGNAALILNPGFVANIGDSFIVMENDLADAVSGTFAGLAEGKTVFASGQLFKVSYLGGDGNDVTLTRVTPPVIFVDDAWAAFTNGQSIADADPVAAGLQPATFGTNAFATPNAAIAAVSAAGTTVIVNAGTYNQAVLINKTITLFVQEGAVAFQSLDDSVTNATVELSGVTLAAGSDGSSTQIDSPVIGTGGLIKQGAGTQTLTGANTYSGTTQVSGGVLKAGSAAAFGATSSMTVDSGATLRLNGFNFTTPLLAGGGTVENAANTAATLTLTGSGTIPTLLQDGGSGVLSVNYAGGSFTPSNTANSYTGSTTVSGGKLSVNSLANGGTNSTIGASTVVATNLVIAGGGTFEYSGGTTSTNRGFSLGAGGGTFAVTAAGNTLSLAGDIANGAQPLTLDGNGNLTAAGVFTGSTGALIKNGAGTAHFTSDLAFGSVNSTAAYGSITTGTITVNAGSMQTDDIRLNVSRPGGPRLISIAAGAFFASTGTIAIDPSFSIYTDQIAGPGTLQLRKTGATALDPSMTWDYGPNGGDASPWGTFLTAAIDLGTTGTHVIVGKTSRNDAGRYAGDLRFDGPISGAAGLQFTGLNVNGGHNMHYALRAANPAFLGAVGIANSDLILADDAALSAANSVTFNSINDAATANRATLFLYGHDVTVGSLNDSSDLLTTSHIRNGSRAGLTGGGTNSNNSAATLNVFLGNDDDSTLTVTQGVNGIFHGTIADGPNDTGNGTAGTYRTLNLVKQGTGTLTLTGASTHTGTNEIKAGTVLVNNTAGSGLGTGAVTVDATAVLGGSGSFAGTAAVSGKLAPGSSPGLLSTGSLTLTGTFLAELNGTAPGTGYDQVNVTGTVDLTGSTLSATAAAITGGSKLTIISNDDVDPVVGTFTGLAEGAGLTISGQSFTISYLGGDGNDVELTRAGAPAPVVSGIVVNDGGPQRSRLAKVVVNFASPVDAALFQAPGAVSFTRTGVASNNVEPNGTVVNSGSGLLIAPASGTVSSITLTFANIDTAGLDFASLSDGRWQLAVTPAGYLSPNTPADTGLRRLFGDFDNNGTVDSSDFSFFPSFGAAVGSVFDWNNNNDIDSATDFSAFGGRFGYSLV